MNFLKNLLLFRAPIDAVLRSNPTPGVDWKDFAAPTLMGSAMRMKMLYKLYHRVIVKRLSDLEIVI